MSEILAVLAVGVVCCAPLYLLPTLTRRWRMSLPPIVLIAVSMSVILAAMIFGWIDPGEKQIVYEIITLLLLCHLLVGLAFRGLLARADRLKKSSRQKIVIGVGGWTIAMFVTLAVFGPFGMTVWIIAIFALPIVVTSIMFRFGGQ